MDQFESHDMSSIKGSSTKPHSLEQNILRRHLRQVVHDGSDPKIAHTITACCRCRKRKTRCDPGLPRCGPCERSNASCEYVDTTKGKIVSRTYIIYLQKKIQRLEEELKSLAHEMHGPPDAEATMRKAGFVNFSVSDEPRFLGPSSGIGMTRLVMALAKQNNQTKSIKDIVPEARAQLIKERFTQEDQKPTSKIYPLISAVAAPNLPSRELTNSLVQSFNAGPQYLLPTLHEPSFWEVVDEVYCGDLDPYKNFVLRMVIAISMQKLSAQFAGLADSYYLASLPFLERILKHMDLRTLQSLTLMAQYSMVTPTRTAAYWVVGLAVRLCHEMGICEEATIATSDSSKSLDALQVDMRRRLFWIVTSMEFGLAHSLGRPSCATTHIHIDVRYFAPVDDEYITTSGIIPECPLSNKKLTSMHFFKMRLLQAEIRRKLYLKKRPQPKDDQDPWFTGMEMKLKDWLNSCPRSPEGSGMHEIWFKARYNTMVIFLHRPSPQIPTPSTRSSHQLFNAAVINIGLQRKQIVTEPVVTWIWTQSLFLALNTTLYCLSFPEIRDKHPKQEVEVHVHAARSAIIIASQRWPGVESALELYDDLITACLRAYDQNEEPAEGAKSIPIQQSPPSQLNEFSSPISVSSALKPSMGPSVHQDRLASRSPPGTQCSDSENCQQFQKSPTSETESCLSHNAQSIGSLNYDDRPKCQADHFNPASFHNILPSLFLSTTLPDETLISEDDFSCGPLSEQYSRYLHAPYIPQQRPQALSQQEQVELMQVLESAGLSKG